MILWRLKEINKIGLFIMFDFQQELDKWETLVP